MSGIHRTCRFVLALVMGLAVGSGCSAGRGVTAFQNAAADGGYAGCTDTWISGERYEGNRNQARSGSLRVGGKRRILIRFDLAAVPPGHVIHKAVLRLADLGYPRKAKGVWPTTLHAYRLTRAWDPSANWLEHTRTDWNKTGAGDWATPGGEIDLKTDFGAGKPGLIAADTLSESPLGHVHELDVTAIVRQWQAGAAPNHGLALEAPPASAGCTVAGSEWYVPAARPALLVAHGPEGAEPATIPPLTAAPKDIPLHPLAATADASPAAAETYKTVRVGQNAFCALQGSSTDAYVKDAVERFPGTWGWMNMCRVGGRAGDISRALLYFDLKDIPKGTSVRSARLVLSLTPFTNRQVTAYRYGAFLLGGGGSPGFSAEEVTATHRRRGRPWGEGGVVAASAGPPVAIGKVIAKEVEDARGRTRRVNAEIHFDLTGAVRAWVAGTARQGGIVLDSRLEGGAYDFYSARSFKPHLRPYLEIACSPAIKKSPSLITVVYVAPPEGDYWVGPMRAAHRRFKGKPGTLAQYGDSITVTMAFLGYRFGKGAPPDWVPPRKELALKNTSPEVAKELEVVDKHSDRHLWFKWKGARWGCTGQMMSNWLLANIDTWQKRMNPEASVILFGTNDLGRICPPEYTEYMAASVRRMLADGTVPMLTTVPPASGRLALVKDHYYPAVLSIAHGLKVPIIDYFGEIMRRRRDDWDGRLPKFKDAAGGAPTMISRDGVHPAHPAKYHFDFSDEALNSSGYLLRDYLTIRKYYEVITKVFQAPTE